MTTLSYAGPLHRTATPTWVAAVLGTFLVATSTIIMTVSVQSSLVTQVLLVLPRAIRFPLVFMAVALSSVLWPLAHVRLMRAAVRQEPRALLAVNLLAVVSLTCAVYLVRDFFYTVGGSASTLAGCAYLVIPVMAGLASVTLVVLNIRRMLHDRRDREVCDDVCMTAWFGYLENICLASSVVALLAFSMFCIEPKIQEVFRDLSETPPLVVRGIHRLVQSLEYTDMSLVALILLCGLIPLPSFLIRLTQGGRVTSSPVRGLRPWERISAGYLISFSVVLSILAAITVEAVLRMWAGV